MNIDKLISPDFRIGKILLLARALLQLFSLMIRRPTMQSLRFAALVLRVVPDYTMVSVPRLINLYNAVKKANERDLKGDIVECGVWNGGTAAVMGVACKGQEGCMRSRAMWLFDSFEGLPKPGERDGHREENAFFAGWNKGDMEKVRKIFTRLGIPLDNVRIIAGWFDSTLADADIKAIAVLHIDADWYDSVKTVLDKLYGRVVNGGFIILDDYFRWEGCKKAVDEYFNEHGIAAEMKRVDRSAAFFNKAG